MADLRWRIAALVVLTTLASCALLSGATLSWATSQQNDNLENTLIESNESLAQSVRAMLTKHPNTRDGQALAGLLFDEPLMPATSAVALAPVAKNQVDFARLHETVTAEGRPVDSIPTHCFADVPEHDKRASGTTTWTIRGDERLIALSLVVLGKAATPHWLVIEVVDLERGPVDNELPGLQLKLLLISTAIVAESAGLAWGVAGGVQQPVVAVRQVAEAVAAGRLSARVAGTHSGELQHLGEAVNRMAERLTDQFEDLQQSMTSSGNSSPMWRTSCARRRPRCSPRPAPWRTPPPETPPPNAGHRRLDGWST